MCVNKWSTTWFYIKKGDGVGVGKYKVCLTNYDRKKEKYRENNQHVRKSLL